MDDLIAFYRARLDELEQAAIAASPGPWAANAEHDEVLRVDDGITVADGFALSGRQLRATVDHIVLHDPVRTLRRVAAGRKLIELCGEGWVEHGGHLDAIELAVQEWDDYPEFDQRWRM